MGVLQLAVVVVVAQGLQAVLWTVPRMRHLALHWVPAAYAAHAVSQSRQPTAAEAKLAAATNLKNQLVASWLLWLKTCVSFCLSCASFWMPC